jgi:hypothetical protein
MVGVGDDDGLSIVVPIVVLGVVEEVRSGYQHCPGMTAEGNRRPSNRSSATRDRAAAVGWLGFG